MQTFLPYPSFVKSAQVLDNKRLGKQRVETLQILQVIGKGPFAKGWKNHPAVRMWRGYELALCQYGLDICTEWKQRGFNDTCYEKIWDIFLYYAEPKMRLPLWLGNEEFHKSHQSNLIRKDKEFYGPKFPGIADNLPYIWPV